MDGRYRSSIRRYGTYTCSVHVVQVLEGYGIALARPALIRQQQHNYQAVCGTI